MRVYLLFLLGTLSMCLQRASCSLPSFTPASPQLQVNVSMESDLVMDSSVSAERLRRLPGLCRRLKRRRVTVLCNKEKFCWRGLGQEPIRGRGQKARSGQVCMCPRGSGCSRFFVHSL